MIGGGGSGGARGGEVSSPGEGKLACAATRVVCKRSERTLRATLQFLNPYICIICETNRSFPKQQCGVNNPASCNRGRRLRPNPSNCRSFRSFLQLLHSVSISRSPMMPATWSWTTLPVSLMTTAHLRVASAATSSNSSFSVEPSAPPPACAIRPSAFDTVPPLLDRTPPKTGQAGGIEQG